MLLLFLCFSLATTSYAEIGHDSDPMSKAERLRSPHARLLRERMIIALPSENLANVATGRRRRDIKDDILDEDAATAIFGSEGKEPKLHRHPIGPPAPPTQAEYRRQMQVLASGQDHEMQFSPALFERERALPPTTNVVPYDINVDPNFPVEAPRARPIVDEFSTNRVDEEFRTGYRWRSNPVSTLSQYQSSIPDRAWRRAPTYSVQQPSEYATSQMYPGSQSSYGISQAYGFSPRGYALNYRGRRHYLLR